MRAYHDDPVAWAHDCLVWKPGEGLAPSQEEELAELPIRRSYSERGLHGLGKCICYNEAMRLASGSLVPSQELIGKEFEVLAVDEYLQVHVAAASAWDNGLQQGVEIETDKGRKIRR